MFRACHAYGRTGMAMLAAGLALLVVTKEGMGAYAPRGVDVGGETCGRVPVHMRHVCRSMVLLT